MIPETLDLIHEVFGVEKKQLLAQLDISSNGLKYIKEHPDSDKKISRQVGFYKLVRHYLERPRLDQLGSVVRKHFLTTLRDKISAMPANIHKEEVLILIDKLL
jgi:hypothetical protein